MNIQRGFGFADEDNDAKTSSIDVSHESGWGEYFLPASISQQQNPETLRVAVFGSAIRGYTLLHNLINNNVNVVGVATDDVFRGRVSARRRIWNHVDPFYARHLEELVRDTALYNGVPCYTGNVTSNFFNGVLRQWHPDVMLMATFGQKIIPEIFNAPRYGMYNFHPSEVEKGLYKGPDPFGDMMHARETATRMSVHHVDEDYDTGPVVGLSPSMRITCANGSYPAEPYNSRLMLHMSTSEVVPKMAQVLLEKIKETRSRITDIDFESVFTQDEKEALLKPFDSEKYQSYLD